MQMQISQLPNDLHRSALKHSAIAAHNKRQMGNNCASVWVKANGSTENPKQSISPDGQGQYQARVPSRPRFVPRFVMARGQSFRSLRRMMRSLSRTMINRSQ
jgi:hypothetical protein